MNDNSLFLEQHQLISMALTKKQKDNM